MFTPVQITVIVEPVNGGEQTYAKSFILIDETKYADALDAMFKAIGEAANQVAKGLLDAAACQCEDTNGE